MFEIPERDPGLVKDSTLSINYRGYWGDWEAFREIAQNQIDEIGKICYDNTERGLVFSDCGKGLTLRQLIIVGASDKDGSKIGQFGEGLKIACIVYNRKGHRVIVRSKEYLAAITIERDLKLGEDILKYRVWDMPEIKGTHILVEGYRLVENYLDNFNVGNKGGALVKTKYGSIIRETKKRLYKKGIFIQSLENEHAGFSYDLVEVKTEEGRNIADIWSARYWASQVWGFCRDKEALKELFGLCQTDGTFESKLTDFCPQYVNVWKTAFDEKYGGDAALSDSEDKNERATYYGLTNVVFKNNYLTTVLASCGIRSLENVISEKLSARTIVKDLDALEERNLAQALEIINMATGLGDRIKKVTVYTNNDPSTNGVCDLDTREIFVKRSQLSRLEDVLATVLHEAIHSVFGYRDCTSDFQMALGKASRDVYKLLLKKPVTEFKAKLQRKVLRIKGREYGQYAIYLPSFVGKTITSQEITVNIMED